MLQGWAGNHLPGNHLPFLHLAFDPSCPELLQGCGVPILEEAGYMSTIDGTKLKNYPAGKSLKFFPPSFAGCKWWHWTGMKRDGRRQLKEAHRVGNVHQNWTTGNAHVQQLILLPLSGTFPGALPSPCPGPALPVTAWTAGGHFYPVCSQVSLLFSILFKPVLIHHNIIVLQIAFPVTGKMNEEFLPSQHILTQSHWGQVLPHIALLWLHFFHSKSHLALIFFSLFQYFAFLPLPPTPKGSKSKGPLIL